MFESIDFKGYLEREKILIVVDNSALAEGRKKK
jgi:hypothetical protein